MKSFYTRFILATLICIAWAGPRVATATILSYAYSFDTPVFSEPPFAKLNTILSSVGPETTGIVTINTNLAHSFPNGDEGYFDTNGAFTHTGELDTAGFGRNAYATYIRSGASWINLVEHWYTWDPTIDIGVGLIFSFRLQDAIVSAHCVGDPGNSACAGRDDRNEALDMTNLSVTVTETNPVPEPTTLALMGLGLAGIGYKRYKKAA